MDSSYRCSCGSALAPDWVDGLCPACLLRLADLAGASETLAGTEVGQIPGGGAEEVLGRYRLVEVLGRGGMGVVYRAVDSVLGRTVAVKVIQSGRLASPSEIRRFRAEAMAAASLRHPHIVPVYDCGEDGGRHYFTMDLVDGISLAEKVREGPLPPARAARYVELLAGAVEHAHRAGILHRDLKPGNVLIDRDDVPRLTDFGLAKALDAPVESSLTQGVVGTPGYMSPEQALGSAGRIGPASDVYALGAMLYDLLTARPPFRAESPLETLRQVTEEEPARPRALNPSIPRDLETVCLKCLQKDPRRRYASAGELGEDLGRFRRGEPVRARPLGWLGRGQRWIRRHGRLAAAGGYVVGTGLALAIAAGADRLDSRAAKEHAAQLAAKALGTELEERKALIRGMALDPECVAALASGRQDALTNLVRRVWADALGSGLHFDNLVVIAANGDTLVRHPAPVLKPLRNRRERDYYATPMARAAVGHFEPYVSKVYRSVEDGLHKLGIVCVVTNDRGAPLGLVAGMLGPVRDASGRFEALLGMRAVGSRITVAGQGDTNLLTGEHAASEVAPPFALLLHPEFASPVAMTHSVFERLIREDAAREPPHASVLWYLDPLRKQRWRYQGVWVAGFARVPGSPLIVSYQTRNRVGDVLVLAVVAGVLMLLGGLGYRSRIRRLAGEGGR